MNRLSSSVLVALLLAIAACGAKPKMETTSGPAQRVTTLPVLEVEAEVEAAAFVMPVKPDPAELHATSARLTVNETPWIIQIGVAETAGESWMSEPQVADSLHGYSYQMTACYVPDVVAGGDDLTRMIGVHAEVDADGVVVASHVTYAPDGADALAQCVADVIAAADLYAADDTDASTAGLDIAVEFRASAPL
jgi:hypothetical protein